MSLGKPQGLFSLDESNMNVGSYITKKDVSRILEVSVNDLGNLTFLEKGGLSVIDERNLSKAYKKGVIKSLLIQRHTSLDELILRKLIQQVYPNCIVEQQVRIGRYKMDLKLTKEDQSIFIEFDGPSHFAISRYGPPTRDPFYKKKLIEDKTGIEVVNWPYWIQRCERNVKMLFNEEDKGLGVLWSTNIHFGDFYFDDSASIIDKMTERFSAVDEEGYGYFYLGESSSRNNPEHPVINDIKEGVQSCRRLIPKGAKKENYWLPHIIRHLNVNV